MVSSSGDVEGVVTVNDVLVIGLMFLLLVSTLVWVPGLTRLMRP
ncbi:MAG TPA: hypothetical protein VKW09_09055 [bacterium]|nr:hypothetical protein [bacterium]